MDDIVYLNGEFLEAADARVSVYDRGFLFADSLYEVVPFYQGVGFRLNEHLQRLHHGLRAIGIELDLDLASLSEEVVRRNGGGNQAVYIQVTRGTDSCRRHVARDPLAPTVVLFSYPIEIALSGNLNELDGIRVITTEDLRWSRCAIKTTALLGNILALQKALDAGAQEALLVREGFLTEGSSSNLFIIRDNCISTPARSDFILGGTTRDLLLELAAANEIAWQERAIPESDLADAEEVWISSSTRGVLPVIAVNDRPVADGRPGPLWQRMAELYQSFEARVFNG